MSRNLNFLVLRAVRVVRFLVVTSVLAEVTFVEQVPGESRLWHAPGAVPRSVNYSLIALAEMSQKEGRFLNLVFGGSESQFLAVRPETGVSHGHACGRRGQLCGKESWTCPRSVFLRSVNFSVSECIFFNWASC